MSEYATLVIAIIAAGTAIFAVYNSFRKPQEDLDKQQTVITKDLDSKATILAAKEAETKALLLAQQFNIEKERNEQRFTEVSAHINNSVETITVNMKELDGKVDGLVASYNQWHNDVSNKITELTTVIRERLPVNKNLS